MRLKLIYADDHGERLQRLTRILQSSGISVLALPSLEVMASEGGSMVPEVVLICERLFPQLRGLAGSLWPDVKIILLRDGEDLASIPAKIHSSAG